MAVSEYECQACNTTFAVKRDEPAEPTAVRCPACGALGARLLPALSGLGHHGHGRSGAHVHADHAERTGGLGLGCGRGGFGCER